MQGRSSSFTPNLANHVFINLALHKGALLCWNMFGPLLGILSILGQQFEEGSHMVMVVSCPHSVF